MEKLNKVARWQATALISSRSTKNGDKVEKDTCHVMTPGKACPRGRSNTSTSQRVTTRAGSPECM